MTVAQFAHHFQDLAHQGYAEYELDFTLRGDKSIGVFNPKTTVHTTDQTVEVNFDTVEIK